MMNTARKYPGWQAARMKYYRVKQNKKLVHLFNETHQRLNRLNALHIIDKAINSTQDLQFTITMLLEQAVDQLTVDAASLLLFPLEELEGSSLSGCQDTCAAWSIDRFTVTPKFADSFSLSVVDDDYETYYAVPLVSNGKVRGILEVFNHTAFTPDQEWIEFLYSLAEQAAIAIKHSLLFNQLQRTNLELSEAYEMTLEGLVRTLSLRDDETEEHTRRVTEITVKLAEAMGCPTEEIVHIRRGALLHDIGKVGIPDQILNKPGLLTADEKKIMEKHPGYAFQLLWPIGYLQPALAIPYCHHEKWDGSGYPRGLVGEEIPLSARIFAVADVWDALCSNRPYRRAWPVERVLAYIQDEAGKHFDPQVVEVFFRVFAPVVVSMPAAPIAIYVPKGKPRGEAKHNAAVMHRGE